MNIFEKRLYNLVTSEEFSESIKEVVVDFPGFSLFDLLSKIESDKIVDLLIDNKIIVKDGLVYHNPRFRIRNKRIRSILLLDNYKLSKGKEYKPFAGRIQKRKKIKRAPYDDRFYYRLKK